MGDDLKTGRGSLQMAGMALVSAIVIVGCNGCDGGTKPPSDPVMLGLDIEIHNHAQEVNVNENVPLRGRLNDAQGNPIEGARVTFTLDSADRGDITPFAVTRPDSANGFSTRVIFVGRRSGLALITGSVFDNGGRLTGWDTVFVRVRAPINE